MGAILRSHVQASSCGAQSFLLRSTVSQHRAFSSVAAGSRAWSVVAVYRLSLPAACGIFPDQVLNLCPLPLVGRFLSTLLAGKSYLGILDSVYRASPLFLFSPNKFLRAFLALSSVLMLFYFSLDFSLMLMFTTNSFIWLLSYCQILKLKNPEGKVRDGKYFQKIILK